MEAVIEKPETLTRAYPVMEHFYTLQGEGVWTGTAAYFIRLAGCDVGCFWCDVKESWDVNTHAEQSLEYLLNAAQAFHGRRVVVTGGEPLLHDLSDLTQVFHEAGFKLHIETSGTRPLTGAFDWVCFSPKKFKAPLSEFYVLADELKIIVYNKHDIAWAEEQAALCRDGMALFLQPEWSRPESVEWIIEHVKQNPMWRVSLQTHKFLNIP